ncbi:MAG TPA: hypothetical protein VHC49_14190 [Mycobacteriales bacterium]|nr:hypothetical protein [Mycobacteriales bacterium]
MSEICDSCRKPISGRPRVSLTGRRLCPTCSDQLTGLAAGAISGGGGDVGQSIATAGFFARLRARRRGKLSG